MRDPVPADVEHDRTAEPEVREEHRAAMAVQHASGRRPHRQLRSTLVPLSSVIQWLSFAARSGTSAGNVVVTVWPSGAGERVAGPSLPVFGTLRPPAARMTRRARMEPLMTKPRLDRLDARVRCGSRRRSAARSSASTTVARAIGDREQLARLLALQRTPSSAKNAIVAATSNVRSTFAMALRLPLKSAGGHDVMRDVAPSAAGDEDLRADLLRAVDARRRARRRGAAARSRP